MLAAIASLTALGVTLGWLLGLAARYLNAVLAEAALASRHRRPRLSNAAIERSIRQVIEGLGRRSN